MINLVKDTINREDVNSLIDWLNQDPIPRLTKGELTRELETKWSNMLGTSHSVFVNSGSSAILLSLYSLKLAKKLKNKKIIVPGLSWITDISSVMQLGFTPILCDCNLNDLSLDLIHLEHLIKIENPAAVILVSVLGIVPDMDRITAMCKKYNVVLIEDMCEAMNSSYAGKKLGTFGTMSMFSTYFGHAISTIEGGFSNTDDEELATIMLSCRNHGWDRDLSENKKNELKAKHGIDDFNQMYTFYYPGFNLRSTDMQAFLGLKQLDKLERYTTNRFENFKRYREQLKDFNDLDLTLREDDFASNLAFPVVSKNRKEITQKLKDNEVEIRPLIAGNMARQPFWLKKFKSNKFGQLQNCDMIHDYGFYLPNHQDLTFDEIDFICDIVKS
jgi:CDP-4-dehydro-6-deoxyglucose reductase, E1